MRLPSPLYAILDRSVARGRELPELLEAVLAGGGRLVQLREKEMPLSELLPLTQRGDTHARIIGALTPLAIPFWLGSAKLGGLTLGNLRHLDPACEAPSAARLVAGTRRAVFTVHDGGRR